MHRDFVDNRVYALGHRLSRLLALVWCRFEVHGLCNTPPGGAILMCNHASYLDPVLVGSGFDREVFYMARSTLFAPGPADRLLRAVNSFPVHRGRPDRGALKRALELAHSGRLVLIFPEGTRSPDGTLAEAAMGASFLAYHAETPVIPLFLQNSHRVLPRGAAYPRRAKVRLYIGETLDLEPYRTLSKREAYKAIGEAIMKGISDLKARANPSRRNAPAHLAWSRSRLNCPVVRRSADPR